jgi:hypothetical protein
VEARKPVAGMSYDLFVGLPSTRIIGTRNLLAYYDAETNWDAMPGGYKGEIHPRLAQFALELTARWPAMYPRGPIQKVAEDDDSRATGYSFCPSSLYLDFRWSHSSEAYEQVRDLALRHQLLFFNCSGYDWFNAMGSVERGRQGTIFLLDQHAGHEWDGGTSWIEPEDIHLLTDLDWFRTNCHFGYEFAKHYHMQTKNLGETFVIEYRRGSPDQHFSAKTQSVEDIRKSFQLYYEQDERAFSLLAYENIRV